MKKSWILALCLALGGGCLWAQTPSLTDYFLTNSYQRNRLNPALMPQNGYVHIPGIGSISAGMTGNMDMAKFFNAIQTGAWSDSYNNSRLNLSADVSLFSSGWYEGNSFWTTEIAAHALTDIGFSKNFLQNDILSGKNNRMMYSSRLWMSYEVGHARALTPEWNVGGKAKFLWGLRDKSFSVSRIDVNTPDAYRCNSSLYGVLQYNNDPTTGERFITADWGNGGYGVAFDLGVEYRPDYMPGLRFSLAFTDLGFIAYGKDGGRVHEDIGTQSYLSHGFVLADDNSLPYTLAEKGATRATFARMNVGAEYEFYKGEKGGTISAGLLSSTYLNWKQPMSELTATVNFQPLHWFSFALGYSMIQTQQSIGLALNLTPRRGLNLLVATHYLPFGIKTISIPQGAIAIPMLDLSIPMPAKGSNIQVSVGVTVPIRLNYLVPERNSWYEAYLIEHGLYTDEYREAQIRREERERQRDRYREEDRQNEDRRDNSYDRREDESKPKRQDEFQRDNEQRQSNDADRNRDNSSDRRDNSSDRNRTSEQGQNAQRQGSNEQRQGSQRQESENVKQQTTTEVRRETTTEVQHHNTTTTEVQREKETDVRRENTTNVERENTTDVRRENTTNVERQNTTTTNVQRETVTEQGTTTVEQGSAVEPTAAAPATTPATPVTTAVAADSAATTAPVMPITPITTDSSTMVSPVVPVADTTSAVGVQGVQVK